MPHADAISFIVIFGFSLIIFRMLSVVVSVVTVAVSVVVSVVTVAVSVVPLVSPVIHGIAPQDTRVCRCSHVIGIRIHLLNLIVRTKIISLIPSLVSMSEGCQCKMNRTEIVWSTRYSEYKQMLPSFCFNLFDITLYQQWNIDTRLVVSTIPEFLSVFCYQFLG